MNKQNHATFSRGHQLSVTAVLTFVCGTWTRLTRLWFISFRGPSHTPFISFFKASPSEMLPLRLSGKRCSSRIDQLLFERGNDP